VCSAATLVFERFRERLAIVRVRDRVVRQTVILRDRETVMVSRYEKTFSAYLRRHLAGTDPVVLIQFAAAVTATHNFELRRMIRSNDSNHAGSCGPLDSSDLASKLQAVRYRFAPAEVLTPSPGTLNTELMVAVFPVSALPEEVARVIEGRLRSRMI
jgi:hypothetical protein